MIFIALPLLCVSVSSISLWMTTTVRSSMHLLCWSFVSHCQLQWKLYTRFMKYLIKQVKCWGWVGGGDVRRKLGWGVRHTSQNPHPNYDHNLWFSLPYLWHDQRFHTLQFKTFNTLFQSCLIVSFLACVAWRFLSGETAITNPKVARSLGERDNCSLRLRCSFSRLCRFTRAQRIA